VSSVGLKVIDADVEINVQDGMMDRSERDALIKKVTGEAVSVLQHELGQKLNLSLSEIFDLPQVSVSVLDVLASDLALGENVRGEKKEEKGEAALRAMTVPTAVIPPPLRLDESLKDAKERLITLKKFSLDPYPGLADGIIPLTPRSEVPLKEANDKLSRFRVSSLGASLGPPTVADELKQAQKEAEEGPQTVLTSAGEAGHISIQVASWANFSVGDRIVVGEGPNSDEGLLRNLDKNTATLRKILMKDHPVGTVVKRLMAPDLPHPTEILSLQGRLNTAVQLHHPREAYRLKIVLELETRLREAVQKEDYWQGHRLKEKIAELRRFEGLASAGAA